MGYNILIGIIIFMPVLAAFLSFVLGKRNKNIRNFFVVGVTVAEFLMTLILFGGYLSVGELKLALPEICGMGLYFIVDGFRAVYLVVAAFMWMVASVVCVEYFAHYRNRNRFYLFLLITLGATEAIFLSADLYTTFVFFEIMSMASYVWVAQDEKKASLRAGATYLAVAVIGGLVMLMGLFLLYCQAGTLEIAALYDACHGKNVYAAAACLLFGFGAKAGAFPLHIWLPKAHPVAPAPASALLSGILTKTGIFGVLVICSQILRHDEAWGVFILLLGVVTMFLGAVLAVFSIDFKRTLACSSVSQIGFILVGAGMQGLLADENLLAVRGTFLHMLNHSTFKLVLFMAAGIIFMNTHKLDLNEIRGFGRKKPLLKVIYLLGALGIGGIPLFSGYISKTLLHESIVEYIHGMEYGTLVSSFLTIEVVKIIEIIFLISGGLTIAYMCKLFVAVFVEENRDKNVQKSYDEKKHYMSRYSSVALGVSAALILIMGALPYVTMDVLADLAQDFMGPVHAGHVVHYFTWTNLKGSVISVAIGVFVYTLVVRGFMMKKDEDGRGEYINRWPEILDLEEMIYRPVILMIVPVVCGAVCSFLDCITDVVAKVLITVGSIIAGCGDIAVDGVVVLLRRTIYKDSAPEQELEEGNEVTHVFGQGLNLVEVILNKSIWKNHPRRKDFEHELALRYAEFKENMAFVGRGLSYGLILFCMGLCVTLIYLLLSTVL